MNRRLLLVSVADKLHNARSVVNDYRRVGDELWSRFNPDAGMAGTIGYYFGLVNAYRATGHHPDLVKLLAHEVDEMEFMTGHGGEWPL